MAIDFSLFLKVFLFKHTIIQKSHQEDILINNPKIIGNLNHIDKIFIEKSTLISGKIEIISFNFNDDHYALNECHTKKLKQYFIEHPFSKNLISSKSQNNDLSISNLLIPEEPHTYNSTLKSETKPFESPNEFQKPFLLKFRSNDYDNDMLVFPVAQFHLEFAMKTLLLCHYTKTEYNQKSNSLIHDTSLKIHEVILTYCSQLGLEFCGNIKVADSIYNCYKLKLCEEIFYYFIASVNDSTFPRNQFSIIISENSNFEDSDEFILLVCSQDFDALIPNLKISKAKIENFRSTINSNKEQGMQSLVYAFRTISKEEFANFHQKKTNLDIGKNDIDQNQLNELYDSIEQELEILLILNFKELLKTGVYENIAAFKDAKIKHFVLSKDSEYSTIATAYSSGIIDKATSIERFTAINSKAGIVLLKHFLNNLCKKLENHNAINTFSVRLDNSKNFAYGKYIPKNESDGSDKKNDKNYPKRFTLVIDGESLEIIFKNAYLKENFKFLMIWIENMICFQIKPELKHQLVKYIKTLSIYSKVLALGSSYEDFQMFKEADLSIEVNEKQSYISEGQNDLILTNFEKIAHLILVKGPLYYKKMRKIMLYYFYIFQFITFLRFFNEFFSNLSFSYLISDKLFFITGIISTIISIIYFCFSSNGRYTEILETFPLIYQTNALKPKHKSLKCVLTSVIPSLLIAICILSFEILYSDEVYQGNSRSFADVQTQFFICIIAVALFYVSFLIFLNILTINIKKKKDIFTRVRLLLSLIYTITLVLIAIGFSFFMESYEFSMKINYFSILQVTFWKPENLASFFFCVLFSSLINILFRRIYKYFKIKTFLYKKALRGLENGIPYRKLALILEHKYKNCIEPLFL